MSKVVLITGASSGIGKTIGEFLLEKHYIVYGTSRSPENYKQSKFPVLALDVTKTETITSCIDTILIKENRLDILINNAGVGITGPIEELPEVEIKRNFDTNFFGPIAVSKAVLPQMRKQNSGLILNITSIAGFMGLPYRGIYSASKAALEVLTEAFRIELKDFNIKMTNVAPGDFATNIASRRYHAPVLDNSPYKAPYQHTLNLIDADVDTGENPKKMAEAVYKIIQNDNPKIHYKVGAFMQKFSIVLKFILPDKMYERLLIKHYKL